MDNEVGLLKILDKFEEIGKTKYNGKFEDNALNIFEELSNQEKKILIQQVFMLYLIIFRNERVDIDLDPEDDEEGSGYSPGSMLIIVFMAFMIVFLLINSMSDGTVIETFSDLFLSP